MKLNIKARRFKKPYVVMAICAAVLLVLAGAFAVWLWAQNNEYSRNLQMYTRSVSEIVDSSDTTFKELAEASDTTGTAKALRALAQTLTQKAQEAPVQPSMFGLRVGVQQKVAAQQAASEQLIVYANALTNAAEYVQYRSKVTEVMHPVALMTAKNTDEATALATAWQQLKDALAGVQAPSAVRGVHDDLQARVQSVADVMNEMPSIYKGYNTVAFTAKHAQLSAEIDALRPIGVQFSQASIQYDANLAAELATLRAKLQSIE